MCFTGLRRRTAAIIAGTLIGASLHAQSAARADDAPRRLMQPSGVFSCRIVDTLDRPVAGALVLIKDRQGRLVMKASSSGAGEIVSPRLPSGMYQIEASAPGFRSAKITATIPRPPGAAPLKLVLSPTVALRFAIHGRRIARPQNRLSAEGASKYTLSEEDIRRLPRGENTPINDVLLQMPGVVRDEDQQIHVRGSHADLQWRVNGVMLPLDIFSGFGQVLTSRFVKRISLLDGILPARYGYRNSGVIDIVTKDGCENPGSRLTVYGGMRQTARPAIEVGGCKGRLSYYATGFFLHSNLGFSQATPAPEPIHDVTNQGQGFSYLRYKLGSETHLSIISGLAVNDSQFPDRPGLLPLYKLAGVNSAQYPSTAIDSSLDQAYYFNILALDGKIMPKLSYQVAYTTRYSTISFLPDPVGDLIYQGVASHAFHSDFANTVQADLTWRPSEHHRVRGGVYLGEYGVELDDHSLAFPADSSGRQTSDHPVSIVNNFNAVNFVYGIYAEDVFRLTPKITVSYGARYDLMHAFGQTASQLSPRINVLYAPDDLTQLHAGFARYFEPFSFETISPRSFSAFANTTAAVSEPGRLTPYPQASSYWDAGFVRTLASGLTFEEDAYFRLSHDALDLGQFGYVPIFAPFNYRHGRTYGAESSISYNRGPLSLRANFTYSVAQGTQVVSGQFNFTPAELAYAANHYIYFDHQQFYTASWLASYRWRDYMFSIDGTYGSGLRAGFANTLELPANWQLNLAVARKFNLPGLGESTLRLVIINLFNRTNLLRNGTGVGIFQPAYGPRLAVYGALTVPIPGL